MLEGGTEKKKCVVIIPVYNEKPTEDEVLSIKRNITILSDYEICFIHPKKMNFFYYEEIIRKIDDIEKKDISNVKRLRINRLEFDDKYFISNKTYSKLLLSDLFYVHFLAYEYMLIAQTDTLIINTKYDLKVFLNKDYDYWGAPWEKGPFYKPYTKKDLIKLIFVPHPEKCHVGNGGFSLRRVESTYQLVKKHRIKLKIIWKFNEDMFFSYEAYKKPKNYKAAPVEEAMKFALEETMEKHIRNGEKPYAVHAWKKHFPDMLNVIIL